MSIGKACTAPTMVRRAHHERGDLAMTTASPAQAADRRAPLSVSLIALFPEIVEANVAVGVTGRAKERDLWRYQSFQLRDFAHDARKTVDGRPAGGGPGMVLMQEPLARATEAAKAWHAAQNSSPAKVILLAPDGDRLDQALAQSLARETNLVFVAGRYEGVDQRYIDRHVDRTLSIGDYVISGGELAAAVAIDAMVRLLPGALGDAESNVTESFSTGLLDWPQYALTNAAGNADIPAVLQSGNHAAIDRWRRDRALENTVAKRSDLIAIARNNGAISKKDEEFLRTLKY
jgi:tRNA (guanine37-N1)-methyltransferase